MAAAAIAATVGASVGYYAAAYISSVRWAYRERSHRWWAARILVANLFALRSVAIEFGPAELVDSIAIRPLAYYLGPVMFDNVVAGWIFGKFVSDIGFYFSPSSATSDSTDCWRDAGHASRRQTVEPSRRSRLREAMRARANAEGWRALMEQYGTPLLALDPYRVIEQYRLLASHLPGFRLHYAVKASPHPAVLRAVAAGGGSFDVAANAEIDLLGTLGLPVERCIYTSPIKKPSDIDHAYAAGVRTFVVDNPLEAQKFAGRRTDIDILVRLAFRNPSAKSGLSTKFGADPADAELVVKHVLGAGVRFAGFSFHVGSQGATAEPYRAALRGTLELETRITETLGVPTRIIDIGGGFPVSYREPMPAIGAIADIVDEVLGDRRDEFVLLAEPGRFLAADSMTLLTSVVGSAVRDGRMWHYLDDGLYGSYSNVMTEHVHPPILALREVVDVATDYEPVTLAGPTCDSADVIARDYPMPALNVGDVVVSPLMGAYTSVTSSRFNGISATPIVEV